MLQISYDNWYVSNLKNLIHVVEAQGNVSEIQQVVSEIQRGISYATQNPGSINPLLIKMGEGLLGPVIRRYNLGKPMAYKQSEINIDELKQALGNREKDKVIKKMSGSLKSLEEFES